jgi:hypothetical protein
VSKLIPNRSRVRKVADGVRVLARGPSSVVMLSILDEDMGHHRSRRTGAPVTRTGEPVPWYTYPAIEYLQQLDFRDRRVFEWGSGNSSLFWARVAGRVTSVEDDTDWFERVNIAKRPNQTLRLATDPSDTSARSRRRVSSSMSSSSTDPVDTRAPKSRV